MTVIWTDPPLLPRKQLYKPQPKLLAMLLQRRAAMLRAGLRQRLMLRMAERAEQVMQRSGHKWTV